MEDILINDFITKKSRPAIKKNNMAELIKLLRNIVKSGNFEMSLENLKKFRNSFQKSFIKLPEKLRTKEQYLILSVINYILSQDSSESIIILQAKEIASRIEKNNDITVQELFADIPNCSKTLILDFFNKISKTNIEDVRDEIVKFIDNTDCRLDEDIMKIFDYISNQNDEDLHLIIESFILRNRGVVGNRPSLKQYYEKYLSDPNDFEKEKLATQIFLTPLDNKNERQEKLKKLVDTKSDQKYKNIIISKMLKKYEFSENEKIEAKIKDGDSIWLPGKIIAVHFDDDTFDILYDDDFIEKDVKSVNIKPTEKNIKNDLYYIENLNSISQEYKNIIKYHEYIKKTIESVNDKIAHKIETINDFVELYNITKEKVAKVERGEQIFRYNPTSPNEEYDDNVNEEKEDIERYSSEVKKNKNELQKLKKYRDNLNNRQKILNDKITILKKDNTQVNQLKQKAESKLKFLQDNIDNLQNNIQIWEKDKKKEVEDMKKREEERLPPRNFEQRRWTTMDIEKIDEKIKELNEEINSVTIKIDFIIRILKRNQSSSHQIDYDVEIDTEEIQKEIYDKYNKKIPTNFINDLYDEIQDSHAKNEDDNNKFLEMINTDDSDFEESSEMYNKYRTESSESNKSDEKKNIYAGIDTRINEFTDSEKIKQEEMEKHTEEIEAIIKEIGNKNKRELDEICEKYNINIAPIDDITTYREIIINKLQGGKKNNLFNLLTKKEEERIKEKNNENKIKLYDANDENFINFLKNIKENIDNESELKDAINTFFEHIDDTKVEEIFNLMTNNYDINTFKEFLRWFFEQKNDKDSYNFIEYYNKFAYIIENENENKNEDEEENEDDEDEFNEEVKKRNCYNYKQILEKHNIVDESTMSIWKQNNNRTNNNKRIYTYNNDDYEMVLLAYKNVFERKLCDIEENGERNSLDESNLKDIYDKKLKIAKKLNIKFNPKLNVVDKDKYIYLIETLNALIKNNKNKNENYKAFDEHLWLRNFWLGINLNDENEVIRKMKEIIKSKLLINFYKNEAVYNSHKYSDIFNQMLNNLSIKLNIQMINEYLQQYRMTFAEYYAQFCINQEKIVKKLNNIQRFICKYNKLFKPDTKCEEEFSSYEQLADHINKIHYDTIGEQSYIQSYFINRPWIDNIIKKTFICNVDNESSILDFDIFVKKTDLIPNKFKDVYGNEWFQVNKHFFNIETNKYISKQQNDEILSFYDNYGTCLLKIKLGFKIVSYDPMKDFIIQNRDIFNFEKEFFNTIDTQLNEITVNKILDDNINKSAVDLGMKYIEKSFSNFEIEYTYDEIFKNIKTENLTIREYAEYIFSICSYLGNELFDNIFRKRLVKQYYNSEEILKLNSSDKIPELNCNDNSFIESVIKYMDDKINKDIYQFGENLFITSRNSNIQLYNLSNQNFLQERFGTRKYFLTINAPEIYNSVNYICKDIGKIEDIIIYSDEVDEKYCLNIKDILKHIYNNDNFDYFPENIPDRFYEEIKEKYNKNIIETIETNIIETNIIDKNKFVNIIISDIIEKTNNKYTLSQLYKMFGIENENNTEEEKNDDTDDEEDENTEEEKEDEEEQERVKLLKNLKKDNEGKYIYDGNNGDEYIDENVDDAYIDENVDDENIDDEYIDENVDDEYVDDKITKCDYCGMKKVNEIVKTIAVNNYKKKDFEIIEICTKCLLNMDF